MSDSNDKPDDQSMSELLASKVNELGELHCSREFTPLLIRWVASVEHQLGIHREALASVRDRLQRLMTEDESGDSND